MKSTPDNTMDPLGNLGSPIRPKAPAPAPRPTETPGINRKPDGKLETQIPLPAQPRIYFVPDCFMGCIGGPNGPIEVHEDRWFFDGGADCGYESEEDAQDALNDLAIVKFFEGR